MYRAEEYRSGILTQLLCLESLSIGSFYASDIFTIFTLMEASTIPIYIMMASCNPSKNQDYIIRYFVYSIAGALLILVPLIMINVETKLADIFEIYKIGVKNQHTFWILMAGLCIKLPIWPFYDWLPAAHCRTNTICSIALASIILKFGTLITVRFIVPIFYDYIDFYKNVIFIILIISMMFTIMQAVFQKDLKQFLAYFSIFHMNLYFMIVLGKSNNFGLIFSMMQHSLVIMLLFFSVAIIEKNLGTRLIPEIESSNINWSSLRKFLILGGISLIGFPSTSGFVSEIISIYSVSTISSVHALLAICTVLGESFVIFDVGCAILRRRHEVGRSVVLSSNEFVTISLTAICILALGLFPAIVK
jgi:NADH-quinone oxidoreductase subunit M